VLSNVAINFIISPAANLENSNLSIANVCLGNSAIVLITNATGLPDGNYQFNYNIPESSPSAGVTGTVVITGGSGQFTIPSSFISVAGTYTFTITKITSLSSGCNNLNETATTTFQVTKAPVVSGAILSASTACYENSNEVFITNASTLNDGIYTIEYQLSGAVSADISTQVIIANGAGSFIISAPYLISPGNVTVTIVQINLNGSQCTATGAGFSPVTFTVIKIDTPQIISQGNEFCGNNNPTIADLSNNIVGSNPVIWYNSISGGVAYNSTDLLIDGQTYYATFTPINSCESYIRLDVKVDLSKCSDVVIPDGFSPNNDGINDEFVIKNLRDDYPNFTLEIYNRYGNVLYKGDKIRQIGMEQPQ